MNVSVVSGEQKNDKTYAKCKCILKEWESSFKILNGSMPTKDDIKKAPYEVKKAYKVYWLLKTSVLETMLCDDEDQNNDEAHNTAEDTKIDNKMEQTADTKNSDSVWGEHLNKPKVKEKKKKIVRCSSSQFVGKLFEGSKFTKRNPCRSYSFNRVSSMVSDVSNTENTEDELLENYTKLKTELSVDDSLDLRTILESCVKESKLNTPVHPVNILQKVLIEDKKDVMPRRKLNEGWLERCNQSCSLSIMDSNVINKIEENQTEENKTKEKIEGSSETGGGDEKVLNVPEKSVLQKINTNVELVKNNEQHFPNVENTIKTSELPKFQQKDVSTTIRDVINNKKRERSGEENISSKRMKISEADKRREDLLLKKVASGKANENFVTINLKKKIYVRGKKTMTSSKYKKQQWRMRKKQMEQDSKGVATCYKCGDIGHFSRYCKQNKLTEEHEESDVEEESVFPTLEEAAQLAVEHKEKIEGSEALSLDVYDFDPSVEYNTDTICPMYNCREDGSLIDTPQEVFDALHKFGYDNFRPGQEEAIMRILSGKSTLLILSTGSGKSLCYQLPSYLYRKRYMCITLVISPLVSLMEDQITGISSSLLGIGCFHTNQTDKQRELIIEKLKNNEISVLLVSPEAIVNSDRSFFQNLPPIAFACIDEVHCISQWSHNFRPSYLMVSHVLREKYGVKVILGLTATATNTTIKGIIKSLKIEDEDKGVVRNSLLPDNIMLTISKDKDRDIALIDLLNSSPYKDYNSIIVYCIRRDECQRIASFIRTSLKEVTLGSRMSSQAEPYHAGLSAARRKRVQNAFMSGKLRIVVATIAFGMGINKSDIRGIIHYNMPRTFEGYVQEIGRAGRDGLPSSCHLFLDSRGNDLCELGRHIYGNSLDRHTIRKLLQRVFVKCKCEGIICGWHEIAFSVQDTVKALDLPEENISTLLCYLQLHPKNLLKVYPTSTVKCVISLYGGRNQLRRASKSCPPLAVAIALMERDEGHPIQGNKIEFSVVDIANYLKWSSDSVKKQLKSCEWVQVEGKWKKTGLRVVFNDVSFRVSCAGNLTGEQLDESLDILYNTVQKQEAHAISQLQLVFESFNKFAKENVQQVLKDEEDLSSKSSCLKNIITNYFEVDADIISDLSKDKEMILNEEDRIICDIERLVYSYKDCSFTGRIIARIFHGISSPNFPAIQWAQSPFWRTHIKEDFNSLVSFATKHLIKIR